MSKLSTSQRRFPAAALVGAVVLALGLGAAGALGGTRQAPAHRTKVAGVVVPPGFAAKPFGASATGLSNPDDITRMNGDIFVTYQNNVGADGKPAGATSTIVEYAKSGRVMRSWSVVGRCDGLTADPRTSGCWPR